MRAGQRPLLTAACAVLLLLAAAPAAGQRLSIGMEGGIASVDDRRGAHPGFGISLLWPMGDLFAGALSYVQWYPGGTPPPLSPAGEIGERGITLVALLRAVQTESILWLVGGGFGQYERVVRAGTDTDHAYDAALTATTILMVRLSERIAVYLRGEIATPTGDWDATWGNLHLGVALPLF